MAKLTDVLKREHEVAEKCHIFLREFGHAEPQSDNGTDNRKVKDDCHYTELYWDVAHSNYKMKYWTPDHIPTVFHNPSGYGTHLFIKELRKKFNKNDLGVIAEKRRIYYKVKIFS